MKILNFISLDSSSLLTVLFILLIIMTIFLSVRELNCWYWKINLRAELLTDIFCELKEIKEFLKNSNKNNKNNSIEKDVFENFSLKIKE